MDKDDSIKYVINPLNEATNSFSGFVSELDKADLSNMKARANQVAKKIRETDNKAIKEYNDFMNNTHVGTAKQIFDRANKLLVEVANGKHDVEISPKEGEEQKAVLPNGDLICLEYYQGEEESISIETEGMSVIYYNDGTAYSGNEDGKIDRNVDINHTENGGEKPFKIEYNWNFLVALAKKIFGEDIA